jgi:hypothetical protein
MKNVLKSVEKIQAELEAIKQAVLEGAEVEGGQEQDVDLDNLDSLKVPELKKIAEDAGIEIGKKPTKKTLIEAILAFYEGEEEDEDEEDEEDEDAEDEDEDEDEESDDDSDDEDEEAYTEEDLEELDDEELLEVAEEFEIEPEYKGKGKKKKLDRDALIEAILEAQEEDEDEEDDEDESDEDAIEFLEDDELDELDTEELMAHYNELAEYCDDEEITIPKAGKVKKNAKDSAIKKAIIALYDAIEEAEEE